MSLKKIVLKGTTRLSLHDRFTFLRAQGDPEQSTSQTVNVQAVRQGLFNRQQQASSKNRRLAQMMDRRPTVMAALRLRNNVMRNRLGTKRPGLSVKDRLTLRGRTGSLRGRLGQRQQSLGRSPLTRPQFRQQQNYRGGGRRGGNRGGTMSRSQSTSNLARSQSMQSLNGRRSSMSGGRGRMQNRSQFRRGGRIGRGGYRQGGDGFYRNRNDFRDRRGGGNYRYNTRGQRSRGFRSRGGGRGRGRGGRGPVPTKEELDSQLDQYMASSRHELDKELDMYMNNQESWD